MTPPHPPGAATKLRAVRLHVGDSVYLISAERAAAAGVEDGAHWSGLSWNHALAAKWQAEAKVANGGRL
jgi:hypothetical protein